MAYLDANASFPLLPAARDAVLAALDALPGNPASPHAAGRAVRRLLGDAREAVAALVGARPAEVVFTSGATESNALALHGVLAALPPERRRLVTTRAEHPSLLAAAERLAEGGVPVLHAGVDRAGRVRAEEVLGLAARSGAGLVSLGLAQSVTGALQPVAEVARGLAGTGTLLHVDAAQGPGRLPDLPLGGAAAASLSAHKLGGPPGVGALVLREGTPFRPPLGGGAQELGRRPGTPASALCCGFGAAAAAVRGAEAAAAARMRALLAPVRDHVERCGGEVITPREGALPNTLLVAFDGCAGDALLAALDALGVRVSTGTACTSGSRVPAEVLLAGGRTARDAARAVRVSVHFATREDEVDALLRALDAVLPRLRAAASAG